MKKILNNDWQELLEDEFNKDYYLSLRSFLSKEYKDHTIYPDKYDIFNALHFTPYKDVKVVMPKWLEFDNSKLTGKINALPQRDDIDLNVQEHLIIELYSK